MRRPTLVLLLVVLALVQLLVVAPLPPGAVGDVSDTVNIRLPGGDNDPARLALRFSAATFTDEGADTVLLATEATFADALASGTLQGTDSPLLLTAQDDLRADVAGEIDRLGAQEVVVLGGTAALGEEVTEELEDVGLDVTRLAGSTRFDTAVEIARLAPESSTAIVSRGFGAGGDDTQAFADALAAGAWAGENGWPTFLTQTDQLTEPTRRAIADSDIETVVLLGGPAAIGDVVAEELAELGVEVERVFGQTRFETATEVAKRRGFDNAEDAVSIVLVEGQAEDAWAAGFSAAAHAAANSAPIVLANGDLLPPATIAFLEQTTFAVDENAVDDPVLICAAAAAACDQARLLLGLPTEAIVVVDEPEDGVPSRETLTGTVDLQGFPATVAVFGPCVDDGQVSLSPDGEFALDIQAPPGVCTLEVEIAFGNGSVQTEPLPILVAPSLPKVGPVVDTETGGDSYTISPQDGEAPLEVPYLATDTFMVDGQVATIGAFEAAVTVADQVTYIAESVDGTIHELTNVDPDTISEGTIGNVDLDAGTFAIIDVLSGVTLRGGIPFATFESFQLAGSPSDLESVSAALSEGDTVTLTETRVSVRNASVSGPATAIDIDAVSGIARFRAGPLGDDPLNAEDGRFRARAGEPSQTFVVDLVTGDFDDFIAALSVGDELTYSRTAGVERFQLRNAASPPVDGLVTETFDPDGSPVAPEPSDGGSIVLLTAEGRREVAYSSDAEFQIDGALATEPEFEAARTPGDEVSYQPGDAGTDTAETIALVSRDLTGSLADISEGANTFDVVTLAGVVYAELDYTAAVFGGDDVYLVDGTAVGLSQFEAELGAIDSGTATSTAVIRRNADGDTEHRLTRIVQ